VSRPAPARPGARFHIVAPSGPVLPTKLQRGVAALRARGFAVSVGRHASSESGYLAGTDAQRASDLQCAWLDAEVDVVICARGGYGALRIVDLLDWELMATGRPKQFVGSSDATVLHEAFASRLGVVTWFGPMPATDVFGVDVAVDRLVTELCRGAGESLALIGSDPVVAGRAEGTTRGGTLTLLASALGSRAVARADGAIVLLEDVNEDAYRVDRMLTQLLRAGWFDGVAAVGLGSWWRCPGADDVLAERLGSLGVPVLGGLPFGHGADQRTIPLGVRAVLDADLGTLTAY
jgi:muramoyltetrapeptide carboxypeptidase